MDKNIAAFLQEDAKTVKVKFFNKPLYDGETANFTLLGQDSTLSSKSYTYVTTLDVKQGSVVVVKAAGELKVAVVDSIDEDLDIEPNSNIKYSWIVDVVDLESYENQSKKNRQLTTLIGKAYQKNLRRSFADSVISALSEEDKKMLLEIKGK